MIYCIFLMKTGSSFSKLLKFTRQVLDDYIVLYVYNIKMTLKMH